MKTHEEINGMQPEHIKRLAEECVAGKCQIGCPYYYDEIPYCKEKLLSDMSTYIEQLVEQIQLMKIQMHGDCGVCKHRRYAHVTPSGPHFTGPCYTCMQKESRPNWEYEGLPELPKKGATT